MLAELDDLKSGAETRDPVCGMTVDPATSRHRAEHDSQTFHFCSAGCRSRFVADPARYLDPKPAPPAPKGAVYICPMDPEVRQDRPGACPICGMALEPEEVAAEATSNHELTGMTRRLWVAAALTVPLVAIGMAGLLPARASAWAQLALSAPVVLWAGLPFFQRGWASLVSRRLNMFTLIALGTGAAFLYSLAATLAPGAFPAGFRGEGGAVAVYFEASATIVTLVLLGQVLELRARERTGGAIRALLNLAPKTARRVRDDADDEDVALADLRAGDRLRVRPGESVPADGVLLDGSSAIDESMVTGEAAPVARRAGDAVIGGTVNGAGGFVMRADKVGADATLARIIAMVAEAQRSRAPIQRLVDRVAGAFVPAVVLAALIAFAAWAVWGPPPSLAYGLVAAVSVLIIACPCALGLATPMSVMVAVGKGAGEGVLIRSAESLERLERVDTLVVDKTGTLTEGKPRLTAVVPADRADEAEIVAVAASLERGSEHPLAGAILAAARDRGLALRDVADFASVAGQGVTGAVGGVAAALGNAALMAAHGVDLGALAARADELRGRGATALFLAVGGQARAVLGVEDPVKASTPAALNALRAAGLRIVMATGDDAATAGFVARALGLSEVSAGASPSDKRALVARLRAEGRVVAMAGDGVNDAPALAEADVGIAMGPGTDVAIQSAGVTLVKGDLAAIGRAVALSRAAMRNIRQNLAFAFAYNAIGIPVAAGALYPVFGLLLSPGLASLAMSASSVSVIANALRLRAARL